MAAAQSILSQGGVTASALEEACGYYANHGWSFTDAYATANRTAWESNSPLHIPALIGAIHFVAEDLTLPDEWAELVAKSIDKPLDEWTEADHSHYQGVTDARKRQLIEPLCTQ